MTIIGKSKAALALILDALQSKGEPLLEHLYVFNNLNIEGDYTYQGLAISDTPIPRGNVCIMGAVKPETKRKIYDQYPNMNYKVVRHAKSFVSENARIHMGCQIDAGAVISSGADLGMFVTVYSNACVQHDCNIGEFVTICPGAMICGGVTVGEGTFVGAGSVIKDGVTIGKNVTIGCGSVVIKDVPDGITIYGNPAKEKE